MELDKKLKKYEDFYFEYEWLKLSKNELKVLLCINMLSQNSSTCVITLKSIQEWLKLSSTRNLEDILNELQCKGCIEYKKRRKKLSHFNYTY